MEAGRPRASSDNCSWSSPLWNEKLGRARTKECRRQTNKQIWLPAPSQGRRLPGALGEVSAQPRVAPPTAPLPTGLWGLHAEVV